MIADNRKAYARVKVVSSEHFTRFPQWNSALETLNHVCIALA